MTHHVLTVQCPSTRGIVAAISGFLAANGCNITDSHQFDDPLTGMFFARMTFQAETGAARDSLREGFAPIADTFAMDWAIHDASERMKVLAYHGQLSRTGFWRTAQQQEVDFLEERNGTLKAFEFKWKHKSNPKLPKTFTNLYPSATAHFIDQTNFRTFTGPFE